MDKQGMLLEIMKRLQRKYSCMNHIATLTNDMREALSRDDRVAVQLLISMRQEEIDIVDECNREIFVYISNFPQESQQKLQQWISSDAAVPEEEGFESMKIGEISRNIKTVLDKTIAVDKMMSRRVAGNDSFYPG